MNKRIEFTSERKINELREETLNYFQNQGFKLSEDSTNFMHFKRGSVIRNMVTFNPLKWKSIIKIEFKSKLVITEVYVNTIFQAVTLKEEELWKNFILNYQKTMKTGESYIFDNKEELKKTKRSSWKYIWYAFIGAIIFGIPSGIVAYITGVESILRVGAISGSLIFMMNRISKEKDGT
ncbi:hypothetical protein [Lewinella cohaerens]|uniref:hypothetical protein n=1 Tax=Lewinella cohaerens TaxID=70995 RepID=UPI0003681D71|nr:hypothetical protein [Lewinella cohaerens]